MSVSVSVSVNMYVYVYIRVAMSSRCIDMPMSMSVYGPHSVDGAAAADLPMPQSTFSTPGSGRASVPSRLMGWLAKRSTETAWRLMVNGTSTASPSDPRAASAKCGLRQGQYEVYSIKYRQPKRPKGGLSEVWTQAGPV